LNASNEKYRPGEDSYRGVPWRVLATMLAGMWSLGLGGTATVILMVEKSGQFGWAEMLVPLVVVMLPGAIVTATALEGAQAMHTRSVAKRRTTPEPQPCPLQ
jgi:hypothetical protein